MIQSKIRSPKDSARSALLSGDPRGDNDTVTLAVGNTGPGISAADLPHIYERFRRAAKARTGAAGRSGLCLAMAKAMVQAHGGSIEHKSYAPGAGLVYIEELKGKTVKVEFVEIR